MMFDVGSQGVISLKLLGGWSRAIKQKAGMCTFHLLSKLFNCLDFGAIESFWVVNGGGRGQVGCIVSQSCWKHAISFQKVHDW